VNPPTRTLELGLHRPLEVREEIIRENPDACRIAYISDIHLRRGRSERLAGQVLDAVRRAHPDLILLGGDLVDQASELPALTAMLKALLSISPVFAIPGNHDIAIGESPVRQAVEDSGAIWIHRRCMVFPHLGRTVAVSGTDSPPAPNADVRVLCAHNPRVWPKARHQGFDLVLAGHLHGCQAVAFERCGKLYPGAWFYPHNHLRQTHDQTHLLVSRGCSDLIPIRWRCPREILLCII
jgi:uncharacterized protein